MDLMQLATQLMKQFSDTNRDGQVDMDEALSVLSRLFSDGGASTTTTAGSSFDLSGLVNKMQKSGLSDIVGSWLGDGDNMAISGEQITEVLGKDKVEDFASTVNLDVKSAQDKLADLIPQLVDKSSSGGQLTDLLNAAGGLDGVISGLSSLFAKKS